MSSSMSETETQTQRPKRADARRNYDKLVAAARAVFTENGTSAPLEDVADDRLEGRETGSEGLRQAESYVVDEFTKAKLQPAGSGSNTPRYTHNQCYEKDDQEDKKQELSDAGVPRRRFT